MKLETWRQGSRFPIVTFLSVALVALACRVHGGVLPPLGTPGGSAFCNSARVIEHFWCPKGTGMYEACDEGEGHEVLLVSARRIPSKVCIDSIIPGGIGGESVFLYLGRIYTMATIEAGGRRLWSNADAARNPWGPGAIDLRPALVRLPDGTNGTRLNVEIESWYSLVGVEGVPALGPYSEIVKMLVARDAPIFALGIIFLFIGVCGVLFHLLAVKEVLFVSFGAFSVLVATYTITGLEAPLLFADYNAMLFNYLAFISIPVPLIWFVKNLFSPHGKGCLRILLGLQAALGAAGLALLAAPLGAGRFWGAFNAVTMATRLMYVLDGVVVVIACTSALRQGDGRARVVLVGLFFMVLTSFHEVLRNSGIVEYNHVVYPYGMFAFTLSLFVVVVQRVVAIHGKVLALTRERERLIRELHDGIGRHLTNIKMISDMALYRESSRDDLTGHIDTISGIARDAIQELRDYMDALESHAASWRGLVDTLREEGRRLLRPHGVRLELTVREDAVPCAQPTALQWFHTTRIFHEALENAIKHSDCNAVQVAVDLGTREFKMTIRDVGTGAVHGRIVPGRGIMGMESRARELGGSCRVAASREGRGVEVVLRFPISGY